MVVGAQRKRRRLAWTAWVLAGGLALAACSSGHARASAVTPSTTSRPTTTTTLGPATTTTTAPATTTTTRITSTVQANATGPWTVVVHTLDVRSASPALRVRIQVPRVQGASAAVQHIDAALSDWAEGLEHSFEKEVRTLPADPGSTSSVVATARVTDDTSSVLSIREDVLESVAGAAHPGERVVTFNFAPATGALLTLADLFRPGSGYLDKISSLAEAQLRARLGSGAQVAAFAGPEAGNFGAWYLEPKALVLAFPDAPEALGVPEVKIPLSALAGLLLPSGPVPS